LTIGINNTGGKFATGTAGVVGTGGKFATGSVSVNEPSGQIATGTYQRHRWLSMTPVANNGNNMRLLTPFRELKEKNLSIC
jgi:hypothetical protein